MAMMVILAQNMEAPKGSFPRTLAPAVPDQPCRLWNCLVSTLGLEQTMLLETAVFASVKRSTIDIS